MLGVGKQGGEEVALWIIITSTEESNGHVDEMVVITGLVRWGWGAGGNNLLVAYITPHIT